VGKILAVTEGLVLVAAWVEFGLLLGLLAFVVLTGGTKR
jgi:hypothetical protein